MQDVRKKARDLMEGFCRVCNECNGKTCVSGVPGMGGAGTGSSFKANSEALAACKLNMRLIHDVADPDTTTTFLGRSLDLPVMAAPIGGVAFNMGDGRTEKEYLEAVLGGCHEKGILGGTPDGVPDVIHQTSFEIIKALGGAGIPFIKPWEDEELYRKLDGAAKTGASIVGMDIDAAGLFTLRLMGRPVYPRSVEKIGKIISDTPMKFILKGIMTPEDAEMAVEAGAASIVVSNHGGRVLDHTPGTAAVLPAVADKVAGRIPILVDGGIRTGVDVLKMIALGADAVMIGRPFTVAAMGGLKEGVLKYIDKLKLEFIQAMILTGCRDVKSIDRSVLYGG